MTKSEGQDVSALEAELKEKLSNLNKVYIVHFLICKILPFCLSWITVLTHDSKCKLYFTDIWMSQHFIFSCIHVVFILYFDRFLLTRKPNSLEVIQSLWLTTWCGRGLRGQRPGSSNSMTTYLFKSTIRHKEHNIEIKT